jgi:hypothetical protein
LPAPTEQHAILSIFTIARVENDGLREGFMHLNGQDALMKTRFVRCHQGSEHVTAIEIWALNILRKHEQISAMTPVKAYSWEIETGEEYEFGIRVKALATA